MCFESQPIVNSATHPLLSAAAWRDELFPCSTPHFCHSLLDPLKDARNHGIDESVKRYLKRYSVVEHSLLFYLFAYDYASVDGLRFKWNETGFSMSPVSVTERNLGARYCAISLAAVS